MRPDPPISCDTQMILEFLIVITITAKNDKNDTNSSRKYKKYV